MYVDFTWKNARLDINCYKTFKIKLYDEARRTVKYRGCYFFARYHFATVDGDGGGKAFAPRPSSVGSFEAEGRSGVI